MFEKVNPMHPDKIADRIAGALVDIAYKNSINPKVAIEVLIGHGECHIVGESSYEFSDNEIDEVLDRLAPYAHDRTYNIVKQDFHLANNQNNCVKCGDNGIFKGMPVSTEQYQLTHLAKHIYRHYPTDGKYIIHNNNIIICQSNASTVELQRLFPYAFINPLGEWTGGTDVDAGATNRKLGSDMGDSVTGGGLHGKDLSKADVSVNIYAWLKAQETNTPQEYCCAIGDTSINGIPYEEIVIQAKAFIDEIGGFEKFAEWGLIR